MKLTKLAYHRMPWTFVLIVFIFYNVCSQPTINCPMDTIVPNDFGLCGAIVNYSPATYTINGALAPQSISGYTNAGEFEGSTYFISINPANAVAAKMSAASVGGHLAVIQSAAENIFIANALNAAQAWIGFDDSDVEGKFVWHTGQLITYDNWAPGEPDNDPPGEDFTEINGSGFELWSDLDGSQSLIFVVEFDGIATLVSGGGSGCFFDVGTQILTYQATDFSGAIVSCSFEITVQDTEPPECITQNVVVNLDNNGNASITPAMVDNGSTDNCGIASMSLDRMDFGCIDAYDYFVNGSSQIVSLTVNDIHGNSNSCNANVVVLYSGYDSDCDGVGDECDECPGADDSKDANNDLLADCANYPGPIDLDPSWYCSNNPNRPKIFICHTPPGNNSNSNTICVSANGVPAHIAHGDYVGPCTTCPDGVRLAKNNSNNLEQTEWNVYPNPASNYIYINYVGNKEIEAQIQIINLIGVTVWNQNNINLDNLESFALNVENILNPGIYLILMGDGHNTTTRKLIIGK